MKLAMLSFLYMTILLSLHSQKASAAGTVTVEETCQKVTSSRPIIGNDYCLKILKADPASKGADHHGLSIVVTKKAADYTYKTQLSIDDTIEFEAAPNMKSYYENCSKVYSMAFDRLKSALTQLESKQYHNALAMLASSTEALNKCDKEAGNTRSKLALGVNDKEYEKLTNLALGIATYAEE